jgi:ribose transport system substrate-binding protein
MIQPETTTRRTRKTVGVALTAAVVLSLLACSSPSSPETSTPPSADAAADCVTAATASVEAARKEAAPYYPTDSKMSLNAGKSVWFIANSSFEIVQKTAAAFEDAAKAAGMTAKTYFSNGSVADSTAGIQQAINQKADGIVVMGDPAQLSNAIKEAADAKISIAWFSQDVSVPLPAAVKGSVPADWHADGALIGDWILADSGCDARVGILQAPTITSSANEAKGVTDRISELCPKCEVQTADIAFATLAADIPSGVRTIMTKQPDTAYIIASYDSLVPLVTAALAQVGSPDVKVIGHDGSPENLSLVRDGRQAIDIALPPVSYLGQYILDNLGTVMAGGTPRTEPLPSLLLDSKNIGASNDALFTGYADSLAQFEKAWQ